MNKRLVVVIVLCLAGISAPAWALFCPYCGVQAADDARFCQKCGKAIPVVNSTSAPVSGAATTPTETGSTETLSAPPSPRAFQVTSHYLNIEGQRLSRNGLFWIAEIVGERARIWCVNEPPEYGMVMGWVSFPELEKRTTWKRDAAFYCIEPPPPTAEIVVVHQRPYWRHWTPRPFLYRGHHGRGHGHRHGGF